MALDLSDEALGLPGKKDGGVNLSDEALGLPAKKSEVDPFAGYSDAARIEESRKAFGTKGRQKTYEELSRFSRGRLGPESPFSIAEELRATVEGIYGLATMAWGGATKLMTAAAPAKAAGLSAGEAFTEEYNSLAKNASEAFKPLAPEGFTITHKIGELLTKGIQGAGGMVFEKGLPLPAPFTVFQPLTAKSPAAGAAAEAVLTLASLIVPFTAGKGTPKPTPRPQPGKQPLATWEEFAAQYPEAAKNIDASSMGAVRFRREDTSIADAISRQVNTELGLTGEATNLPLQVRAMMIFDKVAPTVPAGEKLRAVQALTRKIEVLDQARLDLSNKRGLPDLGARALEEPITVTKDGVALTPEQARELHAQFARRSVEENADALSLSVIGQLRTQAKNVLKQTKDGPEYNMELSALERMWRSAFPDEYLGRRDAALEKFMNFEGDMTYQQVVDTLGPARLKSGTKRQRQAGAIDIEGIDYLLNSFRDLPDQPILKRSTIVGQLNRQGVPQAEKDVVLKALRDRDTITQAELTGSVAADVLPLKGERIGAIAGASQGYPTRIGINPRQADIVIWDSPIKHGIENHFDGRDNYFAHTRQFDHGGIRHIVEVQSDLAQRGVNLPQRSPAATAGVLRVLAGDLMEGRTTPKDLPRGIRGEIFASDSYLAKATKEEVAGKLMERAGQLVTKDQPVHESIINQMKPLEKRWYERILMEENRQAARDGVGMMRVPTPETLAQVEHFQGNLVPGVHDITPQKFTLSGPLGKKELTATKIKIDKGGLATVITDSGMPVDGGSLRTGVLGPMLRDVPRSYFKDQQTILDFYKREVLPFTRARWGAKEVMDEFGHTWLEWKVNPNAASEKIPAFGGRLPEKEAKIKTEADKYLDAYIKSGGPRGRQRGAIDIPDWEDMVRAKERGEAAVTAATERGWTTPPPADNELYLKTKEAFANSRKSEEAGHKNTMESMLKRARREVVAHDYDLRAELERAGDYGQRAVDRLALQNGATMAAKSRMDAINEGVFNSLDRATKEQVDEMMRLRRIIEIDSYKGVGKHKHPEGITGPEAEAVAIRMKQELGDQQFGRVYDLTNRIMKEYKDILSRRHDAGLLSDESYLKLLHFDYSPTEFIDLLDPLQTFTVHGRPLTVRTSGVPFLERGKRGAVVMDSQLLLAEALVRSENLIFKNETMKQLHELATKVPENGLVSLPAKNTIGKEGTPDAYVKHVPKGQVALGVRSQGKQDFVLMREDLAEQFIRRPQIMPEFTSTMLRIGSGSAALKATATTYNPAFIIAGLPMDILHTWLATSGHYSPHLPMFAGQMAADLMATAKDAWTKGPRYQQGLREGLGSAFMTHEGRGFSGITEKTTSVAERQMMPRFEKLKAALSYFNESADIWVRMAHRERLIKQGMDSWQATGEARNRLDYSAGGAFTRAVDTVIPYTNVAVQAVSKVVQAGARDKADLATKLAWGGSAITAWTMANMISSPETWQQIPTSDKIRSLPITFGDQWYVIDPDGNKRYVYAPGVRMDAVVAPLAATIVAGMEQAEYGKAPDGILTKSITNLNPVMEFRAPPTIEAIGTYLSNYDALTGRPITPHFGQVKPEHEGTTMGRGEPSSPLAQAIGGATGMSPPRLDAAARKVINTNNMYLSMMGYGYRYIFEGDDPRVQAQATEQMMLQNPAIRPFLKLTNPSTRYMAGIEEKREEEGSRRKQMTDSVDDLLFQVRKGQAKIGEVQTYIKNQAAEDREWLHRYATTSFKVKEVMQRFGASDGIPNESWWRSVAALEPRPRAQEFYSQWLSASPEDRGRMERIAVGLHNAGAGFYSDNFRRELARERQLLGTERR